MIRHGDDLAELRIADPKLDNDMLSFIEERPHRSIPSVAVGIRFGQMLNETSPQALALKLSTTALAAEDETICSEGGDDWCHSCRVREGVVLFL